MEPTERAFELLFQNNPMPMAIYDPQTRRYLAVNPAKAACYGYSVEEMLAQPLDLMFYPEDHAKMKGTVESAPADRHTHNLWRLRRKDGSPVWVEARSYLVDYQGRPARLVVSQDVTAQVQITDAMHAEQQFSDAVVDTVDSLVVVLDREGRIVRFNKTCEKTMGYTFAEVKNRRFWEIFITPEEAPGYAKIFRNIQTDQVPHRRENVWITKDGTPELISWCNAVRCDESGWVQYVVATGLRITESRRAEKALREAERNYRSIFENAIDGIFQTTLEGRYQSANPALARIYGYASPDELLERLQDITRQLYVDPQRREDFIRQMSRSEYVSDFEAEVYRQDGSTLWITEQARLVRDEDGNALYYEGTVQDITERKSADAALRQAEASYRSIFENALDGIYRASADGRIIKANPALARMLGYETPEALMAYLTQTQPNYVDPARHQEFMEQMAAHDRVTGFEYQVYSRSGAIFWLTENAHAERDAAGRLLYYEGSVQDITARKALEAEREQLLAEALERGDHDPLTGLLNHRAFHKRYAEETARAQRDGNPLAVAVFDLDNFKFFNDAYGHAVGDDVLRQVAETLRRCSRRYDIPARFGGDEFALLMPGLTAEDAVRITERLMAEMNRIGYQPPGSATPIPLSLSIGLAAYPEDDLEQESVLEVADARLLRSKSGGAESDEIETLRLHLTHLFQGFSMLDALVTSVDNKDRYTRRHSEDVMRHALRIAQELGLSGAVQQTIQVAALLHDVGKIGVPDRILRKPGALTDEEVEAIKQHPLMGAVIVGAVAGFSETLDAIRHHHERWDGGGYPSGLRGEETPRIARLMAVADAYSAMTMDRPYRKGRRPEEALAVLTDGAGRQWDPECVAAFQRTFASHIRLGGDRNNRDRGKEDRDKPAHAVDEPDAGHSCQVLAA